MLALVSLSMPAFADNSEKPTDKANSKPMSKAFLNYLAELVEVDGKLVHPTELAEQATTNSSKTKAPESNNQATKTTKDKEEK